MLVRLSDISELFAGRLSPATFRVRIADDVDERRKTLDAWERGRVIPVRVTEDADVIVSSDSILVLCQHFVRGELSELELAYVADALQLAERVSFDGEAIADYVAELTDPEINGKFTIDRAREVANALSVHT